MLRWRFLFPDNMRELRPPLEKFHHFLECGREWGRVLRLPPHTNGVIRLSRAKQRLRDWETLQGSTRLAPGQTTGICLLHRSIRSVLWRIAVLVWDPR